MLVMFSNMFKIIELYLTPFWDSEKNYMKMVAKCDINDENLSKITVTGMIVPVPKSGKHDSQIVYLSLIMDAYNQVCFLIGSLGFGCINTLHANLS